MRPRLPATRLAEAVLAAALLQAVPALAQPAGWVDPPAKPSAKPAAPAGGKDMGNEPAKEPTREAARPALAETLPQNRAEAPSHRVAERQRLLAERRRVARETATKPGTASGAFAAAPSEVDAGGRDPRLVAWAGQAQRLTDAYLGSFSASNAETLAATPRFYGEAVRFYGRTMSTAALVAEKRRFLQRWPERRYEAGDGTMRTSCSAAAATCVVRTVMGFSAASPGRGVRSQGVSELSLTVSFAGPRPVIVAESSRVLHRGAAALSAVLSDPRG